MGTVWEEKEVVGSGKGTGEDQGWIWPKYIKYMYETVIMKPIMYD